jgi:hypothetical protein
MLTIKEMPAREKYVKLLRTAGLTEQFVPQMIRERLDEEKVTEMRKIWSDLTQPVPEDASYEEKHQVALGNMMRKWTASLDFMRKHLGNSGVEEFMRRDVEADKGSVPAAAQRMLKLIRAISPHFAFKLSVKQLSYEMQIIYPYQLKEMTPERAVLHLAHCPVPDIPGAEEGCTFGCQVCHPLWLAEQFNVKIETVRNGKSCDTILSPIKH